MACRNSRGSTLVETLILLTLFCFLFLKFQMLIHVDFKYRHNNRWEKHEDKNSRLLQKK